MRQLLGVHYDEDFCRIINETMQLNLNILRTFSLNLIKQCKFRASSKMPLSKITLKCLLEPHSLFCH